MGKLPLWRKLLIPKESNDAQLLDRTVCPPILTYVLKYLTYVWYNIGKSFFMTARSYEIRDPIHGFIVLSQQEVNLINTRAFQRLRRIRQLAMAFLVYPGTLHTRFDHSIGVMHIAGRICDRLKRTSMQSANRFGLLHYFTTSVMDRSAMSPSIF